MYDCESVRRKGGGEEESSDRCIILLVTNDDGITYYCETVSGFSIINGIRNYLLYQ